MYMGTNIRDNGSFTAGSGMPKTRQNARAAHTMHFQGSPVVMAQDEHRIFK
jgi:hypothetical protein